MVIAAALAVAVLSLAVAGAVVQALRAQVREHARERQLLTNQVLHLSGKTWQPPPADVTRLRVVGDDDPVDLISPHAFPE